MEKGISLLICTHNSSQIIKKTLSYLLNQKVRSSIPWEIVLVDNASTDGTSEIARSFWNSDMPLRIIYEPKPGVAYARSTGMNACQYSYIGFIDDDNWVMENWVEAAYDSMESHLDAGAIGGPSEAVFEIAAPGWFEKYSKNFAVGEQYHKPGKIEELNRLLWGAGLVLRKEAWDILNSHGYEPIQESRKGKNLRSGEESEILLLLKIMGFSLYYEPELKIKHFMPKNRLNWQYFLNLKKSLGASSVYLDLYRALANQLIQGENPKLLPRIRRLCKSFIAAIKDPIALLAGILNVKQGNFRIATAYFNLGKFHQMLLLGSEYEILLGTVINQYASLNKVRKTN